MEKFLNPCDKEYMKMAMLKHEEMFRKQVYELHRLYEIQKMLMKNISSDRGNRRINQDKWTKSKKENSFHNYLNIDDMHEQPGQKLDLEQPAEENTADLEEGEIELTLGPSSYCRRRKIDETPLTSDSGLSFSSSSSGSSRIKRTNSGIHTIQDRRKEVTAHNWGLVEVPNSNLSFLNGRRSNSDIKEQVRQDRVHEQPPWLFQVLSMNIT